MSDSQITQPMLIRLKDSCRQAQSDQANDIRAYRSFPARMLHLSVASIAIVCASPQIHGQTSAVIEAFTESIDQYASESARLSLGDAIDQALQNNLNLQRQRIDPEIQEQAVIAQEAQFDLTLFSRANLSQSELNWNDDDGDPRQTISDSRNYSAGATKRIATGADVTASASLSRSDGSSFNPDLNQLVGGGLSERASISLDITQPLLRDAGVKINRAAIRMARSQERSARYQLRNDISDLLQDTEIAYWTLADSYARRATAQTNLELAQKLVDESRERFDLGLVTRLEVLQSETNLAQQKEAILRAEQAITNAADDLQLAMGTLNEQVAIDSRPNVNRLPPPNSSLPQFETVLQTAFARNFDTAIQEELLSQLREERLLAKNDNKPQLDLSLSASVNGLSNESGRDAFDEALNRRGDDWQLGFAFSLPWGKRITKSNLFRTELRLEQAEYQMAIIRQNLLSSVRVAWREAQLAKERLQAAGLVVELQQATYEQEKGRYDEGLSTVRQLLETKRDLDTAIIDYLDARLSAMLAEVNLSRVEGTLLERHGITWEIAEDQTPRS